jgi:protein-S-isoprenylcysteine O-methyltransferase Ste14
MFIHGFLAWLPLVVITIMMSAAKLRAGLMHRRGLRVVVIDRQRPWCDIVYDLLLIVVFVFWFYMMLAEAIGLSIAWLPEWLTAKLVDSWPAKVLGAVLVSAAPVLYAAALRSLGASWRIGIDRIHPGPLMTGGLFAWSRNPIYAAFDLVPIGAFLIHGRFVFLVLAAALVALIHAVVLREERFLDVQYGQAFRAYCQRVGRYASWLPRR